MQQSTKTNHQYQNGHSHKTTYNSEKELIIFKEQFYRTRNSNRVVKTEERLNLNIASYNMKRLYT